MTRYIQQQKMKNEMVENAVVAEKPSETKIEQNDSLETEMLEEIKEI